MRIEQRWRRLGWRHPLWDYVRFYTSLRQNELYTKTWLEKLRGGVFEVKPSGAKTVKGRRPKSKPGATPEVSPGENLELSVDDIQLFLEYIDSRESFFNQAFDVLRTKDEALDFCERLKVEVDMTSTKLEGWTNTPQALKAAVTNLAKLACEAKGVAFVPLPQRRGVWLVDNKLHVSARNLDGAIPSLYQPQILWEIKEYWGGGEGKSGGSKMSDAVYECNLVGRELREFEERSNAKIVHIVFVDGRDQFASRQSDLKRFIDLFHQGLIDHLFIGREVETDWPKTLSQLI